MIKIHPIPAFQDNYIWIIHDHQHALIVDPGESENVLRYLEENSLTLTSILITHHHYDHINGVEEILKRHQVPVYSPDDERINFDKVTLKEGQTINFEQPKTSFNVLETPGHTSTHIVYYNTQWLFCGDCLFSMGCGRLFEGSAEQMTNSLNKIKNLNPSTQVFCTHEYTLANLDFCLHIEPHNQKILKYKDKVNNLRKNNQPSLPIVLADELEKNPFLRTNEDKLQKRVSQVAGIELNNSVDTFAQLRSMKDTF